MKKVFYAIISILSFQPVFAGVLTVSNAPVNPGQYNSISGAIAAAGAGDTILIQGTTYNYGSFTVNKRLVFIGPGHNPEDKQNTSAAVIDNIAVTPAGAQSRFYGLNFNQIATSGSSPSTQAQGVVISNCLIRSKVFLNERGAHNWIIDGCVFSGSDVNVDGDSQGYGISNLQIRNTVFNGRIYNFPAYTDASYSYIDHCVFLKTNTPNPYSMDGINYFYVTNTIFYRANPRRNGGWVSFDKCLSFNVAGGDNSFSANSNGVARTVWEGVDPEFEDFPAGGAFFSYAHNYRLKSTSTVKAMGTDATDLGVYGGVLFSNILLGYNQNGIPINPYIKSFNITGPTSVNAGDNLQISVEAKVRN
jgi:hypothetical protein